MRLPGGQLAVFIRDRSRWREDPAG